MKRLENQILTPAEVAASIARARAVAARLPADLRGGIIAGLLDDYRALRDTADSDHEEGVCGTVVLCLRALAANAPRRMVTAVPAEKHLADVLAAFAWNFISATSAADRNAGAIVLASLADHEHLLRTMPAGLSAKSRRNPPRPGRGRRDADAGLDLDEAA